MPKKFKVEFLDEALKYLRSLDQKVSDKILYNMDRASHENNPKLFKKLNNDIWEFRTLYSGIQYRFLAFWDKSDDELTLVIATHGYVKKTSKVAPKEIEKAEKLMMQYWEQ